MEPPEVRPAVVGVASSGASTVAVEDERVAWSAATRTAQALHTAEELLWGLRHHDWRVRCQSVDRLAARWGRDLRTLPALLEAAAHDRSWQVRSTVVMRLTDLRGGSTVPVLQAAAHDRHEDVRESAQFALFQRGIGEDPGFLGRCDDPGCPCCRPSSP